MFSPFQVLTLRKPHGLIYDAAFLWSKKIQLSLHLVQKYE